MTTYKTTFDNNDNISKATSAKQNQPQAQIEKLETKNKSKNWREFLETQEFYLEAAGN